MDSENYTSSIYEISFQATTHLGYCANVEKGTVKSV